MINNAQMSFSLDEFVQSLHNMQEVADKKILYQEAMASGRFVRASLGVFRDNNDHSIWKLETGDDGKEYIVRSSAFDVPTEGDWSAAASRTGDSVTLAYKQCPIRRFAKAEFNFDDANEFASFLVSKASRESKAFIPRLLKTLPLETRLELQQKFAAFREI